MLSNLNKRNHDVNLPQLLHALAMASGPPSGPPPGPPLGPPPGPPPGPPSPSGLTPLSSRLLLDQFERALRFEPAVEKRRTVEASRRDLRLIVCDCDISFRFKFETWRFDFLCHGFIYFYNE